MFTTMFKRSYYLSAYIMFFILTLLSIARAADDQLEFDTHVKLQAFSSEISPQKIGRHILNIISTAERTIIIASDKCTNEEFLDDMLDLRTKKSELTINIITGEDRNTSRTFQKKKYHPILYQSIPKKEDGGKMHNKFIVVDDKIVITGSPNLTYAAYNYNIESCVAIENKYVATLYQKYYAYIIDPQEDKKHEICALMALWNSQKSIPIQICLAPLTNISDFIIERINTSKIMNINMFLLSRAKTQDGDIIDYLAHASNKGTTVTIKVDKNQYDRYDFMKDAIQTLIDNNVTVATIQKDSTDMQTRTKLIKTIPQFHDKLMLIEYEGGSNKVIIGSAGFTTNVQDNLNYENMVSIRHPQIFNFLLKHFNAIENSRSDLEVEELQ